jgi:hypothetical protein
LQLIWTAPANALSLDKFSDVAHQVTENLPGQLPDLSTVNENFSEFLDSEQVSNFLEKVEDSKNTVTQVSGKIAKGAIEKGRSASSTAVEYGQVWGGTALEVGSAVGSQALTTGAVIGEKALSAGSAGLAASQSAFNSAVSLSNSAKDGAVLLIQQGSQTTSYAVKDLMASTSEAFRKHAEPYLEAAIAEIDIDTLLNRIDNSRSKNPELDNHSLAHQRIAYSRENAVDESDWEDIATSITEMIFEVAGIYGLPLNSLEREDEVFEITSLGLGSAHVVTEVSKFTSLVAGFFIPGTYIDLTRDGSDRLAKYIMFGRVGEAACDYYESSLGLKSAQT